MNHSMTVCAQQCKLFQLGLRALDKGFDGSGMVRFNEPSTSLPVTLLKVERAHFTTQSSKLLKRFALAFFDKFTAPLPYTVDPGQ